MEFMRITSAANPSIKLAKNLAQHSRAARKEGLSLAEGIHLARELLSHPELVRKVFLREGAEKNFEISEILQKYLSLKISVVQLPSQIYASISPVDTSAGIVCEIRIPEEGKIRFVHSALTSSTRSFLFLCTSMAIAPCATAGTMICSGRV